MYLYAIPEIHVRDMKITADFNYKNGSGIFSAELDIIGECDYSVKLTLTDINGNKVYESDKANVRATIPSVRPWSAEELTFTFLPLKLSPAAESLKQRKQRLIPRL